MSDRELPGTTAVLSRTGIFENLSAMQYELLTFICEPLRPRTGQVLVREQESSDDLYIVARGGVEVIMDPNVIVAGENPSKMKPQVLTELREGQVFGEIALVDQGLRSATVRASRSDTYLLRIPRERLMRLCDTYPELGYKIMKNLAADLAMKLRNTGLSFRQYQLMLSQGRRNEASAEPDRGA